MPEGPEGPAGGGALAGLLGELKKELEAPDAAALLSGLVDAQMEALSGFLSQHAHGFKSLHGLPSFVSSRRGFHCYNAVGND